MTSLVGILNITSDSFSDGGLYESPDVALNQAMKLSKNGVKIIDIGAESTRPGAKTISPEEEWKKLSPVISLLKKNNFKISIDTRNSSTAKKSLEAGADWINDVSGFNDNEMIEATKNSACKIVVMHNLGIPANPQNTIKESEDVVEVVYSWGKEKIEELAARGISKERIIFDPGIGFGKTATQSLELIKSAEKFKNLGVKILFGHSEKSFLKLFTDKPAGKRGLETAIISAYLSDNGIDYIRVHNPEINNHAISLFKGCLKQSDN